MPQSNIEKRAVMTPEESKAAYQRDGFILVHQFLPQDEMEELNTELDRYIREVVPALPVASAFYQERGNPNSLKQLQHMGCDPFFDRYRTRLRWVEMAQELVGEPVEAHQPEWFNKPPATPHRTPPHQDNYYFCLRPPNVVTLWVALDFVDESNGCLRYLPGSHHQGIRPHGPTEVLGFSQGIQDWSPEDEAREVAMRLEPGNLVAHHCEMVHRADPNRSHYRHRRAFAMVFQGVSCRRDQEAYQRYRNVLQRQHASMGLTDR